MEFGQKNVSREALTGRRAISPDIRPQHSAGSTQTMTKIADQLPCSSPKKRRWQLRGRRSAGAARLTRPRPRAPPCAESDQFVTFFLDFLLNAYTRESRKPPFAQLPYASHRVIYRTPVLISSPSHDRIRYVYLSSSPPRCQILRRNVSELEMALCSSALGRHPRMSQSQGVFRVAGRKSTKSLPKKERKELFLTLSTPSIPTVPFV